MHTMHLLPSVAIQPNLELKTRPKQLLGSLLLVIVLPAETLQTIEMFICSSVDVAKQSKESQSLILNAENSQSAVPQHPV